MSSHLAVSTLRTSNSKIGSFDTVWIIPPAPLRVTTASAAARRSGSFPASRARALMDSSSSSGPGRAWIAHRGSRRRSLPLGEERGMAARSLPPARTGQNGCSLGAAVGPYRGQERDREAWRARRRGRAAAQSGDAGPAHRGGRRHLRCARLKLVPGGHDAIVTRCGAARLLLTHLNGRPEYLIREPPFGAVARPPVWLLRLRRRNALLDGGCPVTAAGSGAGPAAAGAAGLCGLGVVVAGRVSAGGFPVVGDGGHQLAGATEPVEGRAQAGEVVHERFE